MSVRSIEGLQDLAQVRKAALGFVINTKGEPTPWWTPTAILHRARCGALSNARGGDKYLSDGYLEASNWLDEHRPTGWEKCGLCNPRPSPAEVHAGRVARQVSFVVNDKGAWGASSVLHEVDCRAAALATSALKEFPTFGDAETWLRTKYGPEGVRWSRCGICRPSAPRASPQHIPPQVVRGAAPQIPSVVPYASRPTAPPRAPSPQPAPSTTHDPRPAPDGGEDLHGVLAAERARTAEAVHRAEAAEAVLAELRHSLELARQEVPRLRDDFQALKLELASRDAAWDEVVQERDVMHVEMEEVQAALAVANEQVVELRGLATRHEMRQDLGDDAAFAREALLSIADRIAQSGLLGDRAALPILDDMLIAAPAESRLVEYRGVALSLQGSDREAIATLTPWRSRLGALGRSAFVLSSIRAGQPLEEDDWLVELDWADDADALLLRSALARMPVDRAVQVIGKLRRRVTQERLRQLLQDAYERECTDGQLVTVLELWESVDPQEAAGRVVDVATRRPVDDQQWTTRALERALPRTPDNVDLASLMARRLAEETPAKAIGEIARLAPHFGPSAGLRFRHLACEIVAATSLTPDQADALIGIAKDLPARWRDRGSERDAAAALTLLRSLEARATQRPDAPPEAGGIEIVAVDTALAVLEATGRKYPTLVILPEAYASAARWGRPNLAKLRKTLEGIGRVATSCGSNRELDIWAEIKKVPCQFAANVSSTALQAYPEDYFLTDPEGNEVQLGPHFLVGSKANLCRVYLSIDEERRRLVVGHVGSHLRDASTNH